MLRQNMMNILLAAVAVGAVLVGYNAFIAKDRDNKSASAHIAQYLNLDVATLEKSDDQLGDISVDTPKDVTPSNPSTPDTTKPTDTTTPTPNPGSKAETIYTIKAGDTYGCIAEKYYGSFEHWVDIVNVNPTQDLGFGEYSLFVDAKLVLPAISAENLKPASSLCN